MNELIHLIGFISGTYLAASKFLSSSLTALGLTVAFALNVMLGLWPVVLQRYNRLRLYRAIYTHSRLPHRGSNGVETRFARTGARRGIQTPQLRN